MVPRMEPNNGFCGTVSETRTAYRPHKAANTEENAEFQKILRDRYEKSAANVKPATYTLAGIRRSARTESANLEPTSEIASNVSEASNVANVSEASDAATPGQNSRGIADAVEANMNWFLDASDPKMARYYFGPNGEVRELELIYLPGEQPKLGLFGLMEIKDAQGNVIYSNGGERYIRPKDRLSAEEYAAALDAALNKGFMMRFEEVLAKKTLERKGIELEENERFDLSVDKYGNVTVTGVNKEKAKAIEDVLNSMPNGENWGEILNRNSIRNSADVVPQLFKNLMENYLYNATGGAVTLNDLYVEDGKIMGLPPELDRLINSIEPDPYYKIKKSIEETYNLRENSGINAAIKNNPDLPDPLSVNQQIGAYISENPNAAKSYDVKSMLIDILTAGVDNIPDLSANVTIGKGYIAWG